MDKQRGGAAIKAHADEFGLSDGISKIADVFGRDNIKDIEITSPGRHTALREFTTDPVRVVPGVKATTTAQKLSKKTEQEKPSWRK